MKAPDAGTPGQRDKLRVSSKENDPFSKWRAPGDLRGTNRVKAVARTRTQALDRHQQSEAMRRALKKAAGLDHASGTAVRMEIGQPEEGGMGSV
jgi:hypothetical protein